jgi:SAM-dependent MidA family methyltransferase
LTVSVENTALSMMPHPDPLSALPCPSPDAMAASQALCAHINALIDQGNGWLSFADYMTAALYTPGLGYYSGGARKFGPEGDFITAPEISPLFAQTLAQEVAWGLNACGTAHVLEAGAGTGRLAADLLCALAARDALPERYFILEVSGALKALQKATLEKAIPEWAGLVVWLDALPEAFSGVVLANEVLDVMPFDRVIWQEEGIFEQGLGRTEKGQWTWAQRPANPLLLAKAQSLPCPRPPRPAAFVSEIHRAAQAWVGSLGACLERGLILLIDYGYPQAEYYLPHRSEGTLTCYYRHHAHADPFFWPGLNDITAFVDFTAMAQAGFDAGLSVLGYATQAQWLFNNGILDALAKTGPTDTAAYLAASRAVVKLTSPHEMGELFKVLALGKGIPNPPGFTRGNRINAL